MKDGRDKRYTTDESGKTWATDKDWNIIIIDGEKIPGPAEKKDAGSGWIEYDLSRGHCGLCGRLTCIGRCFK